jgi:hypothetical protein
VRLQPHKKATQTGHYRSAPSIIEAKRPDHAFAFAVTLAASTASRKITH